MTAKDRSDLAKCHPLSTPSLGITDRRPRRRTCARGLSTPSLGITGVILPLIAMHWHEIAFNSLSRDHSRSRIGGRSCSLRIGSFNSLSRDHLPKSAAFITFGSASLSTPSLGITEQGEKNDQGDRWPFNSLSRDHPRPLRRARRSVATKLSTPSLGITERLLKKVAAMATNFGKSFNSLSRDHYVWCA